MANQEFLIELDWTEFKTIAIHVEKIRYVDRGEFYLIRYTDEISTFQTSIIKDNGADHVDFDSNYKTASNTVVDAQKDSDGATLNRSKIAPTGWTYHAHFIEIETAKLGSLYDKMPDGSDFGWCTVKLYDINDSEITDQSGNEVDAVKTILDWEPNIDFEVIGGEIRSISVPTGDVRLWVVGVPDVPAQYGGSKVMISGLNFLFLPEKTAVKTDGRVSKRMVYDSQLHTGKIRFILKHSAGYNLRVFIKLEGYKQ